MTGEKSAWRVLVAVRKEVLTPVLAVTWLVSSFVVALAGPFGTFGVQPFGTRFGYWSLLIAVAILLAVLIRTSTRLWRPRWEYWKEDLFVAAALSVTFGPFVHALNTVWSGQPRAGGFGWIECVVTVFAVTMMIVTLRRALMARSPGQIPSGGADRLLDRMGSKADGLHLTRVSSDNHHVNVVLSDGSTHRLRLRLRDAVAEIDKEEGFCVHRSHWVARAAITSVRNGGTKAVVLLEDGSEVPVGAKYRDNLVTAGFVSD